MLTKLNEIFWISQIENLNPNLFQWELSLSIKEYSIELTDALLQ